MAHDRVGPSDLEFHTGRLGSCDLCLKKEGAKVMFEGQECLYERDHVIRKLLEGILDDPARLVGGLGDV